MNIIYSQEQNSKKQKKDTIKSSRVHCNIKKKLKNKNTNENYQKYEME